MINNNTKVCNICGKTKPLYEFRKDTNRADGYRNTCKSCRNEYERRRLHRKRLECIEYKGNKCALCGVEHTLSNDHMFVFHHINTRNKLFDIGTSTYNLDDERIRKELNKCILVCGNCHLYCHSKFIFDNENEKM